MSIKTVKLVDREDLTWEHLAQMENNLYDSINDLFDDFNALTYASTRFFQTQYISANMLLHEMDEDAAVDYHMEMLDRLHIRAAAEGNPWLEGEDFERWIDQKCSDLNIV